MRRDRTDARSNLDATQGAPTCVLELVRTRGDYKAATKSRTELGCQVDDGRAGPVFSVQKTGHQVVERVESCLQVGEYEQHNILGSKKQSEEKGFGRVQEGNRPQEGRLSSIASWGKDTRDARCPSFHAFGNSVLIQDA